MIIVISQPMLFPWVGMIEQMRAADVFVWYPDVQFSKGSFVNRVQIKTARGMRWLTVPLHNLRLGQRISDVRIDQHRNWRKEHEQLLLEAYANAPYWKDAMDLVRSVYTGNHQDIGSLAKDSQMAIFKYYELDHRHEWKSSESLGIEGTGSDRVLKIVLALGGDIYLTGQGARHYLDHEAFERAGVRVEYMDYAKIPYPQMHGEFTPHVSALDLIANLGRAGVDRISPHSTYWKDFLT